MMLMTVLNSTATTKTTDEPRDVDRCYTEGDCYSLIIAAMMLIGYKMQPGITRLKSWPSKEARCKHCLVAREGERVRASVRARECKYFVIAGLYPRARAAVVVVRVLFLPLSRQNLAATLFQQFFCTAVWGGKRAREKGSERD